MTEHNIVIGSRGSRLAVIQSEMVRDFIREKKPGRNSDHENDR